MDALLREYHGDPSYPTRECFPALHFYPLSRGPIRRFVNREIAPFPWSRSRRFALSPAFDTTEEFRCWKRLATVKEWKNGVRNGTRTSTKIGHLIFYDSYSLKSLCERFIDFKLLEWYINVKLLLLEWKRQSVLNSKFKIYLAKTRTSLLHIKYSFLLFK